MCFLELVSEFLKVTEVFFGASFRPPEVLKETEVFFRAGFRPPEALEVT